MKTLFLLMFLVGCVQSAPKYKANQKVEFVWSEYGQFWSEACKNEGVIRSYSHGVDNKVIYIAVVECHGWTGAMSEKFSIKESQIIRVVE